MFVLKICGFVDYSWWVATSLLWIPVLIYVGLLVVYLIFLFLLTLYLKVQKKNKSGNAEYWKEPIKVKSVRKVVKNEK